MSLLDEILTSTRRRVQHARDQARSDGYAELIAMRGLPRSLRAALLEDGFSLIAEIKRASPSKGPLDLDLDAAAIARVYAAAGARAVSVLTEPDHFAGSLVDLEAASGAGVPVLRKDFIVDPTQVLESRAAGADAVLLIVRIVDDPTLAALMDEAQRLGMDALVEVYDDGDLDRAVAAGASLIGVNHRDLTTFELDPDRTAKLAPRVPDDAVLVGLSGVTRRSDVEALAAAGARAALVGESLVTAPDPGRKLAELLGR